MANNLQQQVDAYETAGLGTLQKMQQQNPKLLVGIALENLQKDMQADQRAKSMPNANAGPSVIDKKLMGLGGLGLGQQEALNTARPGLQQRGQQMRASQLAQAMQQAQRRPAGGIASMPMMRNQMRRMAEGGDVEGEGTGFLATLRKLDEGLKADEAARQAERMARGRRVSDYIPVPGGGSYYLPAKNLMYDIGQGVSGLANLLKRRPAEEAAPEPFDVQGRIMELIRLRENANDEAKARIDDEMRSFAQDDVIAARRRMSGMQAGGAVKKFQPGGLVEETINPQTGLPFTPEEFQEFLNTAERRRDDTMVDASRLPNRLTPAQESERDLAIIEQAQEAQARRDRDKARRRFGETQEAFAGVPSTDTDPLTRAEVATMNERLASNVNPELRDELAVNALRAQYPFMDPEFGLDDLADYAVEKTGEFLGSDTVRRMREIEAERQQERAERAQNQREAAEIERRRAGELERLEAGLTPEQKATRALQQGRPQDLFFPKTEKSRAGIQPEKTSLSDKILKFLETFQDFSGAPKGYEAATFLGRRRAREEAAADRQLRTNLLEREMEGRFDLMKEQERLRGMAARGVALADYASELDDYTLSLSPEYTAKREELIEKYGGGLFNPLTDAEEMQIQQELQQFVGQLRQRKLGEYRSLLDAFDNVSGLPAILEPAVQEYANYNPNVGR